MLRGEPGYVDQVIRLERFRAAHPEISVECLNPARWRAVIPLESGESVLTRTGLRELLDALDRRVREATGEAGQPNPC
jgi:hypothetical protein